MEKKRLGKTDLMVTTFGFGALPLQSVERDSAEKVIRHAYERGVNFFDTARAYTTSEGDLGRALKGVGDEIIVASKSQARDVDKLEEELQTSLKELNRPYIDIYQFHNIAKEEDLEKILVDGGAVDFLDEQKRKGLIRHIGITSHRPQLMVEALKTGRFETVQVPFNIIESGPLEELIPLAQKLDVGVIAMKPVAGGVFTNNQASVKWVLQHKAVVPIPGMCRIEEVDMNFEALESPLSAEELASLEADRDELGSVFCRRCDYCMPCPNGIKTSFIIRAALFFNRFGWDKLNENHIKDFEKGLSCDQCGVCAARCPYELPLTDMVLEESKIMLRKAVELGKLDQNIYRELIGE